MKRTISEIEKDLAKIAFALLEDTGYVQTFGNVSVNLDVPGYDRRYDGCSTEITPKDWGKIFKIPWKDHDLRLFQVMRRRKNVGVMGKCIEKYRVNFGFKRAFEEINLTFKRNSLPYRLVRVVKGDSWGQDQLRLFKIN